MSKKWFFQKKKKKNSSCKNCVGLGIFLFVTASRTVLGPIQPPIEWVLGAFSLGVRRAGREANHLPPCSAKVNAYRYTFPLHHTSSWRSAKLSEGTFYLPSTFVFDDVRQRGLRFSEKRRLCRYCPVNQEVLRTAAVSHPRVPICPEHLVLKLP